MERIVTAATSLEDVSSNLAIGIVCKDGIVIVTTSTSSPHLQVGLVHDDADKDNNDETSTTPLWILSTNGQYRAPISQVLSNTFVVTGGNAVDSSILRDKISRIAESLAEQNDDGQPLTKSLIPCAVLARRVSDHLQQPTQTVGKAGRILAVR